MWHNIFAFNCPLCEVNIGQSGGLCGACVKEMPWIGVCCHHCSHPAGIAIDSCQYCRNEHFAFERVVAPLKYHWPINEFILNLKRKAQFNHTRILGQLALPFFAEQKATFQPDFLMPLPLHRVQLKVRGFNQSAEIASFLSSHLHIPMAVKGAKRIVPTQKQATLKFADRKKNVAHAFWADICYRGKRIALVDDIVTTGHTVHQMASALRRKGAESVEVWAVARAVKD